MGHGSWWTIAAAGSIAAVTGCQVIAGLDTRDADPLVSGCSLPTKGVAQVRIANLVPGTTNADFCFRPSGTTDWGRPVMRNGGTGAACQAGLAYASVTVPFAVGSKKLDIKAIPAGGPCSQAATSELDGVTLGNAVTTIARMGGGAGHVKEIVGAFPEEANVDTSTLRMRVINASPAGPDVELGIALIPDSAHQGSISLPAVAQTILYERPVPFGATESAGPSNAAPYPVDAQGYMPYESGGNPLLLVPAGKMQAIIAWYQPGGAYTKTIYAIGDPQNVAYAVRGLVCDDTGADTNNPLLQSCFSTSLPNFTVDTVSLGLFGANTTAEPERKPLVYQTLQQEDADFVCVPEVSEPDVDVSVASALQAAGLKYILNPTAQASTPPTDPTDWSGHTPPATLTNPPCAGSVPSTDFSAAYQCAVNNCNSSPGSEAGELPSTLQCPSTTVCTPLSCIAAGCTGPFTPLFVNYPACFDCMVYEFASYQSYSALKASCTQSTLYPLAFQGDNPVLLASRFPFAKNADGSDATDVLFLPSTGYRRAVLHAKVLPDPMDATKTVDFFCGYYTSPLLGASLPYVGNYSNNTMYADEPTGTNGWRDEQNLQAIRTVAWVRKLSTGPTIIAGDWHSSVHQPQNVTTPSTTTPWTIGDQSPEISQMFVSPQGGGFLAAHAANWSYPCQYCPSSNAGAGVPNPYNPPPSRQGVEGFDFVTTYLYGPGFSAASVTDEKITNTNAIVAYDPSQPSLMGPISEYYARRIVLVRPQ
jgi:hypothetical protein